MKSLFYGTWLIALFFGTVALAAPEPAAVQKAGQWTTHVTFEPLQTLVYQPNADAPPRRYWYSILTISNSSSGDAEFYPRCDLLTDTFQLVPSFENIPRHVYHIIRKRHLAKYPLLQSMASVGNRLLRGEDHAKDVLVVWRDFDPQAHHVRLYFSGLSNETAIVPHPTQPGSITDNSSFFLRKTLELSYDLQSEAALRTNADVKFSGKRWVMR